MGIPKLFLPVVFALLLALPTAAPTTALSVPADELRGALKCPHGLHHPGKDPVLLVHGTGQTGPENWGWNYVPALHRRGYDVCTVTLPARSMDDIQVASEYVVYAVRALHRRTGRQVDTIGHSQGTLQQRWAVRWWSDVRRIVDDEILLAGPGHGVVVGNAACVVGLCAAAVWQMATGSAFLEALNRGDETPGSVDVTSIYSMTDDLVQPSGTAKLDGARNIRIQALCPLRVVHHGGMLWDSLTWELVVDALKHDGPAKPRRLRDGHCGRVVMPDARNWLVNDGLLYERGVLALATATMIPAEPRLRGYAR